MLSRGPTTTTRRGNKSNPTQPSSSSHYSSSKILYQPHQVQANHNSYGGASRTTLTSNQTLSFTTNNQTQNQNLNSPAHIIHQYTSLLDHKNNSLQESRTTLSSLRLLILKHGKFIIHLSILNIYIFISVFKYVFYSMMMIYLSCSMHHLTTSHSKQPGVPNLQTRNGSLRASVWKVLLGVYKLDAGEYTRLVNAGPCSVWEKIECDVDRTLRGNEGFERVRREGKLSRILHGFCWKSCGMFLGVVVG